MIAIVDYRAGNLTSVKRALDSVGAASRITADPDEVRRAERVVFPGVGAAGAAMRALRETGLDQVLREVVAGGAPVLGICIGCQVILDSSAENETTCLGLIPGRVEAFPAGLSDGQGARLKVPQMGWNAVELVREHPLFQDLPDGAEFYFVHGYYPRPAAQEYVFGQTDYGFRFASIIGRDNLMGLQFHVEKSGRPGLQILKNFCAWKP